MRDEECVEFLQWALPRMNLHWPGFRKVRRQVCRRVEQRFRQLGLADVHAYQAHLEATPGEWRQLDRLCVVTISRFYRDRGVFDFLARTVLPDLARAAVERETTVEAWSAGCASGEEAYTLVLVWTFAAGPLFPAMAMNVLAADVDETMLDRARAASYPASSVRELPDSWRRSAFVRRGDRYHLRPAFRQAVTIMRHDVRDPVPDGPFDLVLCRNVAFTYLDHALQRNVAARLESCLRPGGALVIGSHETLPDESSGFVPWKTGLPVYRSRSGATQETSGVGA